MAGTIESLHFGNYDQLLTALHASRQYGADPAALSLLEFAHERIFRDPNPETDFDIDIFTTEPNFPKLRRSVIESVIAASYDHDAAPYLSLAATGLLEYFRSEKITV